MPVLSNANYTQRLLQLVRHLYSTLTPKNVMFVSRIGVVALIVVCSAMSIATVLNACQSVRLTEELAVGIG